MNLFSNARPNNQATSLEDTKREAFLAVLILAAASDGHLADEEADIILITTRRMQLFKDVSEAKFADLLSRVQGQLKYNPGEIFNQVKDALPKELRETAFATAADLIFADGRVYEREKELLVKLQDSLEIQDDLAARIVEVISIKNLG